MDGDTTENRPTIDYPENPLYIVKGLKSLGGSDGAAFPVRETLALCRCGASKNKPFCDGSHRHAGFKAE